MNEAGGVDIQNRGLRGETKERGLERSIETYKKLLQERLRGCSEKPWVLSPSQQCPGIARAECVSSVCVRKETVCVCDTLCLKFELATMVQSLMGGRSEWRRECSEGEVEI